MTDQQKLSSTGIYVSGKHKIIVKEIGEPTRHDGPYVGATVEQVLIAPDFSSIKPGDRITVNINQITQEVTE